MANVRCPGQNTQFWGSEDIFEVRCSNCGKALEFFKDDSQRRCPDCGRVVFNPRMNFACAQWCPSAKECLGPERYSALMDLAKRETQRKVDMERLLDSVAEEDQDVKNLFKKLYLKSRDHHTLINVEELHAIRENQPELFKKAIAYYSLFTQEKHKS
jgi:DNA-directed RNA polymerase subunit RPC12/RpoP